MTELTALDKVATADAIGNVKGFGIAGDSLEFGGGFRGEALVGVDVENPGMTEGNVTHAPVW